MTALADRDRAALATAQDPGTPTGSLMVLAGNHPELRRVIVDNPACSPELREWIIRLEAADDERAGGEGRADEDSLAPFGWEPSDIGGDPDPFGTVIGDPLMGSPLFDEAESRVDPSEQEAHSGKTGRPNGADPAGSRPAGASAAESAPRPSGPPPVSQQPATRRPTAGHPATRPGVPPQVPPPVAGGPAQAGAPAGSASGYGVQNYGAPGHGAPAYNSPAHGAQAYGVPGAQAGLPGAAAPPAAPRPRPAVGAPAQRDDGRAAKGPQKSQSGSGCTNVLAWGMVVLFFLAIRSCS